MLFDPFEKQLDLPSTSIELSYRQRWQREIVGKEHECFLGLDIVELYAAQNIGIMFACIETGKRNRLIASKPCFFVDWM